ncbi:MAG TPA: flagellar motor switch protein FliN [Acidimicrobiales bacterium]|nr:flagellar motor switch protein FliN [Acidimicrobiales bacterium]
MSVPFEEPGEAEVVLGGDEAWERRLARLSDVPLRISVQIGQTKLPIAQVLQLREGHVIELDRQVGAPVDVVANEHVVIARGEVVEVDDEYGVRITEIVAGALE